MTLKKKLLTVDEIQGAWAIMPTPSTANASDPRATATVDLDETARAVDGLVAGGIDGILTLGTLGECASLTWEEKTRFIATAVEAARGRVPVFAGTTALNTRETIRQTREAHDLGAHGTMLGLPMWCAMDVPMAVQFFRDVAENCPEMAICVYANTEAFRFDFPRPFWAQVSEIPQVVTSKYLNIAQLTTDIGMTRGRIRFLPIDADYYAAARIDPDFCTAFWTSGAVCGPAPAIHLRDAVAAAKQTGDWSAAKRIGGAIGASLGPLFPRGSFAEFSKYNIGLEKGRMDAAGWMRAGPVRPPYHLVPEPYLEGARKSGEMWAALHRELSAGAG